MAEIWQIITLVVLLVFSAFFSGVETAFYSVSKLKVKNLVNQKIKGADALARLKENPRKLIATILIGNNIANIGSSVLATVLATNYFGSKGAGIATGVMTLLILIFGEITPKNLGSVYSEKIALKSASLIEKLTFLLYPIVLVFENLVLIILKVLGADKIKQPLFTEQELKAMIQTGAEEKVIEKREKELLEGVLAFNDITAYEVRTPRIKMVSLNENTKLKEALPQMIQEGFSRIPITRATRDQITGIVHIKDALKKINEGQDSLLLKDIAQKPLFVSKETVLSELFKEFQSKHVHMAIVVDEYGGTSGIVTLEDLMEEIVGEILDEGDLSPDFIMRLDKNSIMVHGETEIEKVNRFLNIEIPQKKNYITISGFLHYLLKAIPKKDDTVVFKNLNFHVEEVADNKPIKVKITRIEEVKV